MDKPTKLEGTPLANYIPVQKVTALEIIDLKPGTGDAVQPGATITAHYTGALCNSGVIFQSSHDFGDEMGGGISFSLGQVITGWQKGVPGMKVGGVRRLVIPADMAYGSHSPAPNIPANADLVFDIELSAIQ